MNETERKACAYCRFWHPWKTVALVDDEPQLLGHCAIVTSVSTGGGFCQVTHTIQGLTANDFVCIAFKDVEA
jgi:hypothetical protein